MNWKKFKTIGKVIEFIRFNKFQVKLIIISQIQQPKVMMLRVVKKVRVY